jgi:hypothetical protein
MRNKKSTMSILLLSCKPAVECLKSKFL